MDSEDLLLYSRIYLGDRLSSLSYYFSLSSQIWGRK